MNDYMMLGAGIICAAGGAELFVRGAVGIAFWLRIAPGIVGATVAAFATSSPELAVGVSAAMNGVPQIAFGDVLGANIVNVGLVLALAVLISAMKCPRDSIRRDFSAALLTPVLTAALAFDGEISRVDGVVLMVVFFIWLTMTVVSARRQRGDVLPEANGGRGWRLIAVLLIGLVILFAAGHLIVIGATGVARTMGIGEFVIGAVIVAVGTTVPELATTIVSKLRGYEEVGLGTVLGSNVFNACFIVAVAAMIHPIAVDGKQAAIALVFGFTVLLCAFPNRRGIISRWRGGLLLLLYATNVMMLLRA